MENYDYYMYLTEEEINSFKIKPIMISGLKGLFLCVLADKISKSSSFQFEIANKFNISVDILYGSGKNQFLYAKKLIDSYSESYLLNLMISNYNLFSFSEDNDCLFPDFSSFNRRGRQFYIEMENNYF